MTMGEEPREDTKMLNFLVSKATSTYNVILRRTGLHAFKAIAFTYNLKIKFLTRNGVEEQKGDQKTAMSCYVTLFRVMESGVSTLYRGHGCPRKMNSG